jgi:hypothetical protein
MNALDPRDAVIENAPTMVWAANLVALKQQQVRTSVYLVRCGLL